MGDADIAVRVENVSKRFRIGRLTSYRTLRGSLADLVNAVRGRARPCPVAEPAETTDQIWALRDVSFEVKRGEVLGIIGPNGAGKSTLLKILSRITEPTEGRITLAGRVGSLLEVGTGFHPELTGRENVYLNGAILGMRRHEIDRRFDEIVAFSGVEKFLDTPVKRYSSGMRVRLGFAVAAHLEPEILIVDEVLAVGDAAFQQKCISKMQSVAGEGRTVLFVSHNMGAVQRLCSRAIVVAGGVLALESDPSEAVSTYLERTLPGSDGVADLSLFQRRPPLGEQVRLSHVSVLDEEGSPTARLRFGEKVTMSVAWKSQQRVRGVFVVVGVDAESGDRIATASSADAGRLFDCSPGELYTVGVRIHAPTLQAGRYHLTVALRSGNRLHDQVRECVSLRVANVAAHSNQRLPAAPFGYVHAAAEWGPGSSRQQV